MFHTAVASLIDGVDIDRPLNALTLEMDLHQDFGNFEDFFRAKTWVSYLPNRFNTRPIVGTPRSPCNAAIILDS